MIVIVSLLAGLGFAAATVLVVMGLTGTDIDTPRREVDWTQVGKRWGRILGVAVAAVVAWVLTGWPVAALAVTMTVWLIPNAIRTARNQSRERQTLDATRMWLLSLRTTLRAGVGVETAIRETARQTRPDSPLAVPLRRLVDRLELVAPATALGQFAHELDNHVADTAVAVLGSAMENSQGGIADALESLSSWANEDLAQLRQVEAEARGLRLARRSIIAVFAVMAVYMTVTSPDLMASYATLTGQAVLVLIGSLGAIAIWWLGRLSIIHRPERFFRREVSP